MKKTLCLVSALLFCLTNTLQASTERKPSSMMQLFPRFKTPLSIDPFLPEGYVLIEDKEEYVLAPGGFTLSSIADGSFTKPIIFVREQEGVESFDAAMKEITSGMKQVYPAGFTTTSFQWGSYSGVTIRIKEGKDEVHSAFVNLSNSEPQVLVFQLLYPSKEEFGNGKGPTKKDLKFWNDFLKKTKVSSSEKPSSENKPLA